MMMMIGLKNKIKFKLSFTWTKMYFNLLFNSITEYSRVLSIQDINRLKFRYKKAKKTSYIYEKRLSVSIHLPGNIVWSKKLVTGVDIQLFTKV